MPQARVNPSRQFRGPFRGLNTTLERSQLGPEWAAVCHNFTLENGALQVRTSWDPYDIRGIPPGSRFLSLFHWPDKRLTVAKTNLPGPAGGVSSLFAISGTTAVDLGAYGMTDKPADMVLYYDKLYVLDGGARMWQTDGTIPGTRQMGMASPVGPPAGQQVIFNVIAGTTPAPNVEYAVTFVDELTNTESNPFYSGRINLSATIVQIAWVLDPYPTERVTHLYVYRRNLAVNAVGYRLIAKLAHASFPIFFSDNISDANVTLSSETGDPNANPPLPAGPFAPKRNGPAGYASCGCVYKDRMLFNDVRNKGLVRFSAVGRPDYVDSADFISVTGEPEDAVVGLLAAGDQALIAKPKSMWVLGGEIKAATNFDLATGRAPEIGNASVYRANVNVGPVSEWGNGLFMGGEPARILIPSFAGLFQFDGATVGEAPVTAQVRRTWERFAGEGFPFQYITHADDPTRGLLWLWNRGGDVGLCWHYRTGSFSTFDGRGNPLDGRDAHVDIISRGDGSLLVAPLPATPESVARLMIEVRSGNAFFVDRVAAEYQSGDMALYRGLLVHAYWLRILLSRRKSSLGRHATAKLRVIFDQFQGAGGEGTDFTRDLEEQDNVLIPVRRTGRVMAWSIVKDAETWARDVFFDLAIEGFEIDAELAGMR